MMGLAQTGTGKTAAFGLPIIERVDTEFPATQVLVLSPTRELCRQITEQLQLYSKYLPKIEILSVYGGAPIHAQIRALKNTQHVIVATPGRLIDLINRKKIDLEQISALVLDEADEMLNMGFKEEIDQILQYTPEEKMTWLFSATMPAEIKHIVKEYMDRPIHVKINSKQQVNQNIEHQFALVRPRDKTEALMRLLDVHGDMRGIIFCRTRMDTQNLAERLQQKGYMVEAIHGDLSQAHRDRVMRRFKDHSLEILVATDVAARGIDVNDLSHVIHFALPDDQAYYTHRSGRTARAGKSGISIALLSAKEHYRIRKLENALKIKFEKIDVPGTKRIARLRLEKWAHELQQESSQEELDPRISQTVQEILSDMSKEELIDKLLQRELAGLQLDEGGDLNDQGSTKSDRNNRRKSGGYKKSRGHKSGGHKSGGYSGKSRSSSGKGKKSYGGKKRYGDDDGPKRDFKRKKRKPKRR